LKSNSKFKPENKTEKFKKEKERENFTCPPKQAAAAQASTRAAQHRSQRPSPPAA
jgi:hypothetical protein